MIYDYHVFALNMDREILYDRINKRVDIMIEQGLVQEVENLLKQSIIFVDKKWQFATFFSFCCCFCVKNLKILSYMYTSKIIIA